MRLSQNLQQASQRRAGAIHAWTAEGTDSYRLFHGAAEGRPGLSIDKYGPLLLAQISASRPLTAEEDDDLRDYLSSLGGGPSVVALRKGTALVPSRESSPGVWSSTYWCSELGLEFAIDLSKAHRDPQLFLDFRAAKRAMREELAGLGQTVTLLNLFAFTCSVSCHAASQAPVSQVWSVDFSAGNLAWGRKNFRRNRLAAAAAEFVEEDCIGLLWALTGNSRALSRRGGLKTRIEPLQFTVVVADPPALSKGKFAAVDLVRDPETVFGPAWQVVAPGGLLIAANNSSKVTRAEFGERLTKMFAKRVQGGACHNLRFVTPDEDFPSFDGEHPLKVAFCRKA